MKNYFIRMFKYDAHENRLMNGLIADYGDMEQPCRWMAHLLAAQRIWLARCKNMPSPVGPLWPEGNTKEMTGMISGNKINWLSYLEALQPADFDRVIAYKNLSGIDFENTLSDILAHVINHGTHHRAQIGQHIKQAGASLPVTDYIIYLREFKKTTS